LITVALKQRNRSERKRDEYVSMVAVIRNF